MTRFSRQVMEYDVAAEADRIAQCIREQITGPLRRRGAVVGFSGGIDSSLVGALCVKALGPKRVFGLLMPERDSAVETMQISQGLVEHLGVEYTHEDITPMLDAYRCYQRRDDAIRSVVPDYGPGDKAKIVLPSARDAASYNLFSVVVRRADGTELKTRLSPRAYLEIVAATNFKQRVRKTLEYFHADRLNYAVAGTPNRLEYDQGFFVKNGDGAADFKPIAHLYKTQVYKMAEFLGVPANICSRPPTTDTYPLEQGQDEFYFSLPYPEMDLCLYAKNNNVDVAEVAEVVGLSPEQVQRVFADIDRKRETTRYLHMAPVLVKDVLHRDA